MKLELTPSEQANLIWNRGDWFETAYGVVTVSAIAPARDPAMRDIYKTVAFFFDDKDTGYWGRQEWTMQVAGAIPNGPAILLVYRRENVSEGFPFGIIHLANRAWIHVMPLESVKLYRKSSRYQSMMMKGLGKLILFGAAWICGLWALWTYASAVRQTELSHPTWSELLAIVWIVACLAFVINASISVPSLLRGSNLIYFGSKKRMAQSTQTARSFLYRISQSIGDFVPGQTTSSEGRL